MPVTLNGQTYYQTHEACHIAGTSKNTFFRWVKEGRFPDTQLRDRRGWRLFDEHEVEELKAEVDRVSYRTEADAVVRPL